MKLKRKLTLSLAILLFASVTLITTTFAWFSIAQDATVGDLSMSISGGTELLVSLDGTNYSDNISKEQNTTGDSLKNQCETTSETTPIVAIQQVQHGGIPLIPTDAMAGFANGDDATIFEYDCDRYVVPMFRDADFLIPVKGSSMIPKYNSGDLVACKRLHISDLFFQWNHVYVLDTDQGALIKRVQRADDDEHILCVSDNIKYEPFKLHRSQIHAIAIVVGVIRLE